MNFNNTPAFLLAALFILASCKPPVQERPEVPGATVNRSLIETNQYIRERHREHIMAFADRAGWDMTETSTGLWYEMLDRGSGPAVEKDKLVVYTYQTRLLNGNVCYAAGRKEPKKIISGKGNIESGLEEGLRLMREGGKARFLVPPYLAHGNFGDGQCIPGSAVLLITAEVLEVKR
ncbi:MAG: FKBP-type peptidyl-prolyl cis-trans isomerase [Bacteroidales bacterium]|nr:FKBP-type peptidyl-prolyl cis-trans isomerase [Bacteroidales bacterium]MDT8430564.1 FKBP-type peptidyl-prolyl cis-trans isomerase [Bacteroidales bacterium]